MVATKYTTNAESKTFFYTGFIDNDKQGTVANFSIIFSWHEYKRFFFTFWTNNILIQALSANPFAIIKEVFVRLNI